jgi:hypothetical protein
MTGRTTLRRLALAYEALPGGALVRRGGPAEVVPAEREGSLFRRIAALSAAPDATIAEAASRYGPLGPLKQLDLGDPAALGLGLAQLVRGYIGDIPSLGEWIATAGRARIAGRLAPAAHMLCAAAETDTAVQQQLLDLLTADRPSPLSAADGERLDRAMEAQQEAVFAALGAREPVIREQAKLGDALVAVEPAPGTGRHLRLAARLLSATTAKADELDVSWALVQPDEIGRLATALQPYLEETPLPPEHADLWRQAGADMAFWSRLVNGSRGASAADLAQARELLTTRLRQVGAWPYPAGEQLGTFGRALWSVWPRLVRERPPRACNEPGCAALLPAEASGNRSLCDEHQRDHARQRAARNRARRAAERLAAG